VPTSNVAVIGDRDSILCFKAVGVDVFPVDDPAEAVKIFDRLVREDYAVIFIAERLAVELDEKIQEVAYRPLPSVVLIPDSKGTLGYGSRHIREVVKKAVGADILAEEQEE
jgi:V/A-type H+-transporting ATPase subunit F